MQQQVLCLVLLTLVSISFGALIGASASGFVYSGRTLLSPSGSVQFDWSGIVIEFAVTGTQS